MVEIKYMGKAIMFAVSPAPVSTGVADKFFFFILTAHILKELMAPNISGLLEN